MRFGPVTSEDPSIIKETSENSTIEGENGQFIGTETNGYRLYVKKQKWLEERWDRIGWQVSMLLDIKERNLKNTFKIQNCQYTQW